MPPRPLLALLMSLSLSACAHGAARAPSRCPAKGGPVWRELRTEHFVVRTDLSSGKARELAGELERVLGAVRHGLFRSPPPEPGTIRVVAPRSADDYALFAPKGAAAFYDPRGPTIVMHGELAEATRPVLAHEVTHHVLARVFARQPLWFGEGTAAFMEAIGGTGLAVLGGAPSWRYEAVFPYHGGIGAVLLAKERLEPRQYGLAWALVHFLHNRHPREFGELQGRFARGEDPEAAWRAVFPQWDPAVPGRAEALDDALGSYLARGKYAFKDVRLPPPGEASERVLSPSEVHATRLSLRWMNREKPLPEGARLAEAEEALAEDPGNVPALRELAFARPEQGVALARRAVELRPEDGDAWLFLSDQLPELDAAGREAALRRAVQASPQSSRALNNLAWTLLGAGRSGEALPLARQAAFLAPWDPAALDTLAGVLGDLGQCAQALQTQRRALDVIPEAAPAEARQPYTERLAALERQCRVTTPAPGAPRP